MESKEDIIQELVKTLLSIREKSVGAQANILLESRQQTDLYKQILQQLSRMNMLLENKKSVLIE